jgi:hypothetical protein
MSGPERIESLIRELSAVDPARREAARRSLAHLGDELLAELARVQLDDPDTRTAVARAIARVRAREETALWQKRMLSILDWLTEGSFIWRANGREGRAQISCRPEGDGLRIEQIRIREDVLEETALTCRSDFFLSPLRFSRTRWEGRRCVRESAEFAPDGVRRRDGPFLSTPRRFLSEIVEPVLASTMPFLQGYSFSFPALDTREWVVSPDCRMSVESCEELGQGRSALKCWRIRSTDGRSLRYYWVGEDRALWAAASEREEWISCLTGPIRPTPGVSP